MYYIQVGQEGKTLYITKMGITEYEKFVYRKDMWKKKKEAKERLKEYVDFHKLIKSNIEYKTIRRVA